MTPIGPIEPLKRAAPTAMPYHFYFLNEHEEMKTSSVVLILALVCIQLIFQVNLLILVFINLQKFLRKTREYDSQGCSEAAVIPVDVDADANADDLAVEDRRHHGHHGHHGHHRNCTTTTTTTTTTTAAPGK